MNDKKIYLFFCGGQTQAARNGNIFPLSGKRFRLGEQRSRAVQPIWKGVAQEVNSRGGRAVCEELKGFHGTCQVLRFLFHGFECSQHSAFSRPDTSYPEHGDDQKGLQG